MRLAAKLPAPSMRALLELRKTALQAQIRQRFAEAREAGEGKPDVSAVSAMLRAVKGQLAGRQPRE